MRGRTAAQAVQRYVRARQAVVSTVTSQIVRATGIQPAAVPHALMLAQGQAVRLTADLALRAAENYELTEVPGGRDRWRVSVNSYWYGIERPGTEHELLAFHRHPRVPGVPFPHLHIGSALAIGTGTGRLHIPTGQLRLGDIVALLIRDFAIRPLRPDWARVLASALDGDAHKDEE